MFFFLTLTVVIMIRSPGLSATPNSRTRALYSRKSTDGWRSGYRSMPRCVAGMSILTITNLPSNACFRCHSVWAWAGATATARTTAAKGTMKERTGGPPTQDKEKPGRAGGGPHRPGVPDTFKTTVSTFETPPGASIAQRVDQRRRIHHRELALLGQPDH